MNAKTQSPDLSVALKWRCGRMLVSWRREARRYHIRKAIRKAQTQMEADRQTLVEHGMPDNSIPEFRPSPKFYA